MPRRRPLADFEMERFASGLPHFRGVFMRDTLPSRPWKKELGIINLDRNIGPGTHWVAYKKFNENILYFDSFGNLRPPLEVEKYFKNCKILYNNNMFQEFNTTNCGQLCINFLHDPNSDLLVYKEVEV